MGCVAGSLGYCGVHKGKITGPPKFHPRVVMFVLETMFPQVELGGVSAVCEIFSDLPLTVKNIV